MAPYLHKSLLLALALGCQPSASVRVGDTDNLGYNGTKEVALTDGSSTSEFVFLLPIAYYASHLAAGAATTAQGASHTAVANIHNAVAVGADTGLAAFHGHLGMLMHSCRAIWLSDIKSFGPVSDCMKDAEKQIQQQVKQVANAGAKQLAIAGATAGVAAMKASSSPLPEVDRAHPHAGNRITPEQAKTAQNAVEMVQTAEKLYGETEKYEKEGKTIYNEIMHPETVSEMESELKSMFTSLCSPVLDKIEELLGINAVANWFCTCAQEAAAAYLYDDESACKQAMPMPPEISAEALTEAAQSAGLGSELVASR